MFDRHTASLVLTVLLVLGCEGAAQDATERGENGDSGSSEVGECVEIPAEFSSPVLGFAFSPCLSDAVARTDDGCGPAELSGEWLCALGVFRDGVPGHLTVKNAWFVQDTPQSDPAYCNYDRIYMIGANRRALLTLDPVTDFESRLQYIVTLRPPEFFDECIAGGEARAVECLLDAHEIQAGICCAEPEDYC